MDRGQRYEELKNKCGKFMVSRMMFMDSLEVVESLLQRVIPYAVDSDYFTYDGVTYQAFSDEFDEISKGTSPPWYDCELTQKGEEVEIKFIRRTD
jgi:hypothetical protein